jgi:four helix bundle protein
MRAFSGVCTEKSKQPWTTDRNLSGDVLGADECSPHILKPPQREYKRIKEAFMIGDDIAERLLNFAVGCLHVVVELEKTVIGKQVARQLSRCSTSGGANYGEARSAESAADFAHKVAIAGKEVGESVYWLKIAHRAQLVATPEVTRWIQEGEELVRILGASARTARTRELARESTTRSPTTGLSRNR